MINKLSIGTANFGTEYAGHKVPLGEADRLLHYAFFRGVKHVDTAACYGSEELLSNCTLPINITTKIDVAHDTILRKNVYACLLHDITQPELYEAVMERFPVKIGASFYYVDDMRRFVQSVDRVEAVQVPYSIYDRRFGSWFPYLAQKGIEIQVRSVFLRGKVFEDDKLKDFAREHKLTVEQICLCFPLLNPYVNHVVMGVENEDQLNDNLAALNYFDKVRGVKELLNTFATDDEDFLVPMRWK